MRRPGSLRRVLLVEPDPVAAQAACDALRGAGCDPTSVPDAETGLRTLAQHEPDALVVELEMAGKDGRWLLKRLRDDFMGARPRVVVLARDGAVDRTGGALSELGVDAVLLKPADGRALVSALAAPQPAADDKAREAERLRELMTISVLSGELQVALEQVAKRLAFLYRASECLGIAASGERQWIGAAHGPVDEHADAPVWRMCRAALDAGAPLLAPDATSWLAVPIAQPGGARLGAIVLRDDQPRIWPADATDGLGAVGARLYAELAWRQVHERIAADRDRLRESSMLDPMLAGVWTRAALDQTLPGEVSASARRREPMTFAVLDLVGMRHINERRGHLVGDLALKHVSYLVRRTLRSQDLVARYSGDALVAVLPGASLDDARRVIERLQGIIEQTPLEHGDEKLPVTVTAGLAALLDDDTGEAALGRAGAAVRAAKRRREALVVADASFSDDPGASASPMGLDGGVTLGGMYQILHEISRGAMGVVYRAEDLGLGRPVALKTLRPDLARDPNFVERFRTEASMLAAIRHENLVQVYAFGTDGEDVYFVMELVEGEPLEDRIELCCHEGRFIKLDEVGRVVTQIAGALDAMHRAGILHRDVKPANILFDRARDRAVLVDVGIAKRRGSATDPAGTPGFTAPEAFTGGAEGAATDVYGLAATAYMLLCTAPPFGTGQGDEIIARQVNARPHPVSRFRAGLTPAIDEVLLAAMDPEPSRRPSSAGGFAASLVAAFAGAGEPVPAPEDGAPVAIEDHDETKRVASRPIPAGNVDDLDLDTDRPTNEQPAVDVPPELLRQSGPMSVVDLRGVDHSGALTIAPPPRAAGSALGAPPTAAPAKRRAASFPGLREPELPDAQVPHTRGVLFRSAYRVLGAREGAVWAGQLGRRNAALGQAMQPQNTLLSWHPTTAFVEMLDAAAETGRDAASFARDLGRVAAAATFSRFFGADPGALSPGEVLAAADLFWLRYHTWGVVTVDRVGDGAVLVEIAGGPRHPLVCASTQGIFEQVASLAGAPASAVEEVLCEASGGAACRFSVRWEARR